MKASRILLFSVLALFIVSCNPQPQACISASSTSIRAGQSVSFTSCALDAKRLVWNFGDGSAETEGESAAHVFTTPGVYQVELKALSNKDKKWDRTTVLINVAEAPTRYLTKIQINSFNITNPQGGTWDAGVGTNPDIVISYGLADSQTREYTNPMLNEASVNQLPASWDFENTVAKPILSNNDWLVEILDNDGVLGSPVFEVMYSFMINPATATPTEPGIIRLTQFNYQIELHFIEL
ncbi:MAG: PKD domain-containing protein [Bacteroidia bacterium]